MQADLWKVLAYFAADTMQGEVEQAIAEEAARRAKMGRK
jgi:hypothetical protein